MPPFPDPDSPELEEIIDEVKRRFGDGEESGAALFAAGLAWSAGRTEGSSCSGCSLTQSGTPISQAIRSGRGEYRFVPAP